MDENNNKSLKEIYFDKFIDKSLDVSADVSEMVKGITELLENVVSLSDAIKDFADNHEDARDLKEKCECYALSGNVMFNIKETIFFILGMDGVYNEYEYTKSLEK